MTIVIKFHDLTIIFHDFQARKMVLLNSMTYHDWGTPWVVLCRHWPKAIRQPTGYLLMKTDSQSKVSK